MPHPNYMQDNIAPKLYKNASVYRGLLIALIHIVPQKLR